MVIRAQALQTQTPAPLQSMENVVASLSSTANPSKDDLEMSKVSSDCLVLALRDQLQPAAAFSLSR